MKLYRWKSKYLKAYSEGYIIAMGETVEQARALARQGFEPHYYQQHCWMYESTEASLKDEEDRKCFDAARALFEADLAQEPEELPGYVLIEGSE